MNQIDHKKTQTTSAEKDELLFGRRGLITQSLKQYNSHLSESEKNLKYQKMAASPYSFYRGSNPIFWNDFEWDWRMTRFGNFRTRTWLNGDCHAYNFGAYDAHDTGIIYGLNDFDESIVADYQYDLWRLAISLVLIYKEPILSSDSKSWKSFIANVKIDDVLEALADAYAVTLLKFAGNRDADSTYYDVKRTKDPLRKFLKKTGGNKSQKKLIKEWTNLVDGQIKFDRSLPEVGDLPSEVYQLIEKTMPEYIKTIEGDVTFPEGYFNIKDIIARKNAGTGSLGLNRYYILIAGNQTSETDYVILDVKEQIAPSAFPYATDAQKEYYKIAFPHEGIRYTRAYRGLDYHPDDHLGWMKLENKYYGVRERNPYKKSLDVKKYFVKPKDYVSMARQWGQILATEHSRADRVNNYPLGKEFKKLTKGKLNKFKKLVQEVALGYAVVVRSDYKIFLEHIVGKDTVVQD